MNRIFGKKLFLVVILFLGINSIYSQQVGDYNFNTCDFSDANANFPPATSIFPPSCDCGLEADGLYLDGNDDHLIFPEIIDSLMEEDFTISFYFQIDQATTLTDIISLRNDCSLDSFLSVSYNPINETLVYNLAQTISNFETNTIPLTPDRCWHRIVITKSDLFYNFYLDDVLQNSYLSNGVLKFARNARLSIANSPCILVNEERFNGWIDEFKFYTRALSAIEINTNSLKPDEIITNDTTIVSGSDVNINVGASCAINFNWSPTTGLDDDTILNPIATPDQTTTYSLNITNSNGCQTNDSITINVITPEDVDCEQLLLPNAFTPNGDQLNDRFGISNIFLVQSIEYFEIYDRWGAKMWETNDVNGTWDGSFKGNSVNPGMYIYKVKYTCDGNEFVKVDNFSVLR